jgi:acyl dehydratase
VKKNRTKTESILRRLIAAAWIASAMLSLPATAYGQQSTAVEQLPSARYQTLYPGVYTAREADLIKKYFDANRALQERGPIDVQKLVNGTLPADTPGLGPVIKATEQWVRYNNAKYDPDNPLRTDRDYARKAGWQDILAYPTFGAHDDTFMVPFPPAARDKLLVSDLNHSVTAYKPIYPGDTLFLVANEREVVDLTPPQGSLHRSLAIQTKGSIYNQRGEKVNDVIFRVTESIRLYKDRADAPANPGFADIWEAPDWLRRPAHLYTDQDWKVIRGIWAKETRRGAQALFWDDVKVGDQPAWTADGPIEASVAPIAPWGMGAGGSRSMKREIMDPAAFARMVRGAKDGIYRLNDRSAYVPATPAAPAAGEAGAPETAAGAIDTTNIHQDGARRSPLVNYMGRDLAIRHLSNWMGDRGWLQNIRWSIMDPRAHAAYGITVPSNPRAEHYLDKVPFMRGKFVSEHGLTQDMAITRSYVTGKYVRDGQFMVDLVWWIETIDGKIWLEGGATVRLPSRSVN